jgi:predicted dehydrogenase
MKSEKIGLVGTGFAQSTQLPAFRACGAEVTAICSGHYENAKRAAAEFGIAHPCEDYRQLVALNDVSLVVVAAPPHLHHPVTLAALEAGKHVICEKPMAMNAREAQEMAERAEARPAQLAIIDHELRFNPTRRRMKELIDDGFVGEIYHVTLTVASGFRHSAQRPWNWWAQKSAGGGLLGALGSHAIDALRWMIGEIEAVCGTVAAIIPARPDPETGEMRKVETDDYCSFLLRFAPRRGRARYGSVLLSAVYSSGGKNQITIAGERGTLFLEGDETLLGSQGYNTLLEDLSIPDSARGVKGLPDNVWARSFYHLADATLRALRDGQTTIPHAATFTDGLRCQEVIDAVIRSDQEQRWIEIS